MLHDAKEACDDRMQDACPHILDDDVEGVAAGQDAKEAGDTGFAEASPKARFDPSPLKSLPWWSEPRRTIYPTHHCRRDDDDEVQMPFVQSS